ncbi:MAG: HEPN domain-containing protein [Leptospira sp.]|nr:HEPN domain-containing protein [Leptospira sp.]
MSEEEYRYWLEASEIDLETAQVSFKAGIYSSCVFHCQQAVEKKLKAILAYSGKPKFTHSLTNLMELLVESGDIPEDIRQAISELDLHYTHSQYPGITSIKKLYSKKKAEDALVWADLLLKYADSLQ